MSTNKPHPHAESMKLYAQDAMETDRPWERWECSDNQENWVDFITHPVWLHDLYYRRKPSTILINGIEVPKPVRVLDFRQDYFYVDTSVLDGVTETFWSGDDYDYQRAAAGLIHLTEKNARKHAEALLSFTQK